MSAYPLLLAPARRPERIEAAIAAFERGVAAGAIANVTFQDAKQELNRALEDAWRASISERFTYAGKYKDLSEAEYALADLRPQLHTVLGAQKRLAKSSAASSAVGVAVKALLDEVAPLAEQLAELKTKVVKRQPKPVEDRKAVYVPPPASSAGVREVHRILVELTEEQYAGLVAHFVASMQAALAKFLAAVQVYEPTPIEKHLSPYGYCSQKTRFGRELVNKGLYVLLSKLTREDRSGLYVARDDAEAVIAAEAKRTADEMREMFVGKNMTKLASILDARGNFDRVEVLGRGLSLGGMTARLQFFFTDGARFETNLQVVYVVNQQGTEFYRTPITFHDVVFGDGKRMKQPSEQKMNEVFARA